VYRYPEITRRIDTNFGISNFALTDFLKPNVRKIKLLSPVAPIKKYEDNDFTNLDLNTTARKELKKLIHLTSFLDCGSFLVITLDLAHAISKFEIPKIVEESKDE
jgi:hypothetical protein